MPELWAVLKVLCLMCIPYALWLLTWAITQKVYESGAAGSMLIFTVIVMFGQILGAAIAGYLIRSRGSARWVAMLGILLMTPYLFIFWRADIFNANAAVAAARALDYYWLLTIFGMLAYMGQGIAFVAQLAYLAKFYRLSNNHHCGIIVGYTSLMIPIANLFMALMGWAIMSNSIWMLIFAVLVVIVGCVWGSLDAAAAPEEFMAETGV